MLVRLKLGDIVALSGTALGWRRLSAAVRPRAAPLLRPVAWLHRRTLARYVRVVAVTGSFGKSSTVRLVTAALGLPGPPASREIANGLWSVPRRVLELRPSASHAVIEIGIDRPGQMAPQAAAVAPDIAVVTAVGGEHLETLGSLDIIRHEKSRLVAGLRAGAVAVLNGDDPRVRAMAVLAPGEVWTYGIEEGNDVRAVDIVLDWPHGMRFAALVRGSTQPVRLPLLGRHMVPSALAALAVAAIEGVPLARAAAAIEAMPPAGARLEILPLADGATLVCDHHKNSVETIRAALELVAEVPGRKLLVISRVRDMTDELLPSLVAAAKLLARVVDEIIVVGDGVEALVAATLAEGFPPGRVHQAAPGAADALRRLRAAMRPGDVVLLKGRIAQKLDRLVLALQGRRVVCDLADCQLISLPCEHCPMLEVGFGTRVKFG